MGGCDLRVVLLLLSSEEERFDSFFEVEGGSLERLSDRIEELLIEPRQYHLRESEIVRVDAFSCLDQLLELKPIERGGGGGGDLGKIGSFDGWIEDEIVGMDRVVEIGRIEWVVGRERGGEEEEVLGV